MRTARDALLCLLVASLVALVGCGCLLIHGATMVLESLPVVVERSIREQGDATRAAALKAIAETRAATIREIRIVRRDSLARVDRLTDISERSIADLTVRADARLAALHATVDRELTRTNDTLAAAQPALENAGRITAQVNDSLPLYLDCDHNPDCVFNRYVGVAQSTEKTMQAIAAAAPATTRAAQEGVEAGRDLARSAASIAKSWEKQTPLYVRAMGWAGGTILKLKAIFF